MTSGIYSITNKVTGDKYIGEALDIKAFLKTFIKNPQGQAAEAIAQYGIENFDFAIEDECEVAGDILPYLQDPYTVDSPFNRIISLLEDDRYNLEDVYIISGANPKYVDDVNNGLINRADDRIYPIKETKLPQYIIRQGKPAFGRIPDEVYLVKADTGEESKVFANTHAAARYLIELGITSAKEETVRKGLSESLNDPRQIKTYRGYYLRREKNRNSNKEEE